MKSKRRGIWDECEACGCTHRQFVSVIPGWQVVCAQCGGPLVRVMKVENPTLALRVAWLGIRGLDRLRSSRARFRKRLQGIQTKVAPAVQTFRPASIAGQAWPARRGLHRKLLLYCAGTVVASTGVAVSAAAMLIAMSGEGDFSMERSASPAPKFLMDTSEPIAGSFEVALVEDEQEESATSKMATRFVQDEAILLYLATHDALRLRLAALGDPEANAAAEEKLQFSRTKRREIQRRLRFAKHDPKGTDGIFGPETRAAITAWQQAAGIPPTGFLTERSLEMLIAETDKAYRSWQIAVQKDRERAERMAAVKPSPRPEAERSDCERLNSGEIEYGKNFRCDLRGLGENISGLFGGGAKKGRRYGGSMAPKFPGGA